MRKVVYQVALQVRLTSQRLKAKALLPLGRCENSIDEKPLSTVLDWVLYHLRQSRQVARFVLLCPQADRAELEPFAQRHGFHIFAGSEMDVLERFQQGMTSYPASYCFRLTGDNPLVHGSLLDCMIKYWEIHVQAKGRPPAPDYYWLDGLPYGLGAELFRSESLFLLQQDPWQASLEVKDREHVTRFLYQHPESFAICRENIGSIWGAEFQELENLRLTLDTPEDYLFLTQLFNNLQQQGFLQEPSPIHSPLLNRMPAEQPMHASDYAPEQLFQSFLLAIYNSYMQIKFEENSINSNFELG